MNGKPNIRLLLTGGGTGGHLFPAIAAAQAFQRRLPTTEVLFVGTKRKIDSTSLRVTGFASDTIASFGLKGKSPLQLAKALAVLPISFLQAVHIIQRFKPSIILGVGGYVTGPVMLAGRMLGIPTVIHEQNSVPGLANRKIGTFVDRICLSLPGSEAAFDRTKVVYTGNPVRAEILKLAQNPQPTGHQNGKKTVLILGGSQGARAVNQLVLQGLSGLSDENLRNIHVIHQTGEADYQTVKEGYEKRGLDAEVQPFFVNMTEVYGQADLLISRAGATTLAEISVLGKPAILIPYPFAADNHQEKNSRYYVAGGGAVMFRQGEVSSRELADYLKKMLGDENQLVSMGRAMQKLAFPDAAEKIVTCCLEVLEQKRKNV